MKRLIYADNAATTQLDKDAFDAMCPFLLNEYGNASQPYSFSRTVKKALRDSREMIAAYIGAAPDEIYFTSGGTESDNWAIKGSLLNGRTEQEIVTSKIEHHAVLRTCEDMERLGYRVIYLPVDSKGIIHAEQLSERVAENTGLVSVMLANNEIGSVQDILALAKVAHSVGAVFHTDAVQAVGHIPIDVKVLDIDMLSASAHKFNGPKGIGFIYIKKGTPLCSYLSGGDQEFGMRAGTENVASIVGMAKALQKNVASIPDVAIHLKVLEKILIQVLYSAHIDFIRNGSDCRIPGNISLSFRDKDGEALLHRLDLMGICVSTGSACDSRNTQISHVLRAIGLDESYARGTIRISLSKSNTENEVREIANALLRILQ